MRRSIENQLKTWLAGSKNIVVAGIGNPIRTDDYVGLKIVEDLKGKVAANVLLIEAETVPESYLSDIEEFQPSHVLLIDAAVTGQKPGDSTMVPAERIADTSAVTTHLLPIRVFCEVIKQTTGSKIALLLVEPENLEFGEGLTRTLQTSANRLVKILTRLLG